MCSEGPAGGMFPDGSEGRPEEMIFLIASQLRLFFELFHKKKAKIENGIWNSIDFICRIDCS